MYFYIMINYRKIRSKNKSRENYFKLLLKEVGTLTHKKYSSLIVNDIKIDFSIYLCKKTLYQSPTKLIKTPNKIDRKKYIVRDKSAEIKRINLNKYNNINNNKNNNYTYVKPIQKEIYNKSIIYTKKKPEKIRISKTPLQTKFKRTVKKMKLINDIYNTNIKKEYKENNKTEKENDKEIINKRVGKIHKKTVIENNPLLQKYPLKRKFTLVHLERTFKTLKTQPIKDIKTSVNKRQNDTNINNNIANINNNEENILLSKIIRYNPEPEKEKLKKTKTTIEEIFLSPINYDHYISNKNNKSTEETFCEGFFICSFPSKNGQVIEKSHSFPALCGHPECSSLPSMKSEIIYRYPLQDTKTLELNNLAATICFPTGIKVCYNEKGPGPVDDYVTRITNQKGERYYMITFHFFLEMDNYNYGEKYEMHPLKDYLRRFADDYLDLTESALNREQEKIEKDLKQAQDFGLRDVVYIPFCICLISKYSYVDEIKKCLQSIFYIIKNNIKEKNEINKLIMHLINSVPIPAIETSVQFYIPYNKTNQIILKYPKLNDIKINTAVSNLLKLFSIDLILIILRLLLFEKKILFIDDDYTLLSNVTDNFISLLYPFQWMHTYIPIMSDQMIQYLETFLPFINGISTTLLPLVKDLYEIGDMEQNEEIFLIYIKDNKLKLGTNLIGKNKKKKYKYKYIEENVPNFPITLEKQLKNRLKKIKEEIEHYEKKNHGKKNLEEFDLKIRVTFMEIFVQMFHDIDKYLVLLDEDIIFNKNFFLEKINKEDKKFYDEFCDTQLFQLFTQNFIKDDFNYFKMMMEDYNKNNGKFIYNEEKTKEQKIFNMKQMYIIPPDYLDIHEKDITLINDIINQKYKIIEEDNNTNRINGRITEYMQEIDEKNYDNKNLNIYIISNELNNRSNISNQNTTVKLLNNILSNKQVPRFLSSMIKIRSKFKNRKNEMSEKEQEELKERIKDFTMKIFKSDISELENVNNNNLTKEILNDINTNIGREFFVNLLSKNANNYILLKNDFFLLLGNVIFNTLLFIINLQEDDKVLDQAVRLIKSLKNFAKEEEGEICIMIKGKKKCEVTLWDMYKTKIKSYQKVNQENFWVKWYKINLDNEKDDKNNPETKKKIIIDILEIMADIELDYSFIKKTIEKINKKIFENNEEKQNEIKKAIHDLGKKKK